MKIQAAVLRPRSTKLFFDTLDLEKPRENEVLVRMVATGICHTDLHMAALGSRVPRPIVLGHEGAGVVEKIGRNVTKVVPGDHVVLSYGYCGKCPSCVEGEPACCSYVRPLNFGGTRPDGTTSLSKEGRPVHAHFFAQSSFATHAIAEERNTVKVRKDVPLELLGPLGCGIQTGAGAAINSLKVGFGHSFAVFGAGSVGISAVMGARLMGASKIIAVDPLKERLALALELGATHTVNPTEEDPVEAIKRISGGWGVDFALDTSGIKTVLHQAFDSLAQRGTCGFVAASGETDFALDIGKLVVGAKKLRGILQGDSVPDVFIPMMIEFYLQGRFPFDRLVKFYDFADINKAFHDSETGKTIKPILRFGAKAA